MEEDRGWHDSVHFYGGMWQSERGLSGDGSLAGYRECAGDGRNGGWGASGYTGRFRRGADGKCGSCLSEVSGEEWAAEAALAPETTEDADKADRASGKCYVYVCGEVAEPGVYVLEPGDRIYEAVEMAGGMTADAGTCAVNLAESVYDGLMVYIPDSEEAAGMTGSMTSAGGSAVSAGGSVTSADSSVRNGEGTSGGTAASPEDGRLNLNTASLAELMTLSGIGQTKAQAVVNALKKAEEADI